MQHSAGIIPYKFVDGEIRFFLGHPGGPMNAKRNFWALLKGSMEDDESEIDTAIREFKEESGLKFDTTEAKQKIWLVGTIKQRQGKNVTAFAMEVDDIDTTKCFSNFVEGEDFPEMDKYAWLSLDEIRGCTIRSNVWFYEEIMRRLGIYEDN